MPSDIQVAIIGFGPSGAVAASLLGQAGIRTHAIEKTESVYPLPRAIALDHEIMRLFDNLGAAEAVLPHTAPFTASQHFGAQGQLIRRIDMIPEPYPMGYIPSMVFTQPPVEMALRAHAAALPGVTVAYGTEVIGIEQTDDAATLHLRDSTGTTATLTADYVIACDGASSFTRQSLGLTLDDLVFDEPWIVIDVQVNADAIGKLPETSAQFCNPARPTTFLIGPGNHRRWEIMLLPGEDPKAMAQPQQVWALLSPWLTPADGTLWRAATYRFHALVAARWREGRVFLAGDAAHQQPPFIGQGMCQGLRDVSNLAWKLTRVIEGAAPDALLDSYTTERAAHVRELTSRIKAIGLVICERDPEAAAARDARILAEGGGQPRTITRQDIVPPLQAGLLSAEPTPARGTLFPQPWIVTTTGAQLLDRVAGRGWRLFLNSRADLTPPETDLRSITIGPDGDLTERDGVLAAWFERNTCHAAIVRPDHYVFGTATDRPTLDALLADLLKRPH